MKLLTTLLTSGFLVLSASAHCGSCSTDSKEKASEGCNCTEKCDGKKEKKKEKDCGCSEKCDSDKAEKVG